jgi:hypothetical protein
MGKFSRESCERNIGWAKPGGLTEPRESGNAERKKLSRGAAIVGGD